MDLMEMDLQQSTTQSMAAPLSPWKRLAKWWCRSRSLGGVVIALNPPASASTQHLRVSPVLPSGPWVHPTTPATAADGRARSRSAHTWCHQGEQRIRTNLLSILLSQVPVGCLWTRPSIFVRPLPSLRISNERWHCWSVGTVLSLLERHLWWNYWLDNYP